MIFILHYLLFNAGLSAILILQILFLQTYSDASLTEIGTLLMVLPFVSILMKPLFCALADRQQAHKLYLMGSLAIMAAGYGSLAIPPFFPDFIENHGRLVWYLDILGIVIGFSAFGVAWSLGDALAVNGARVNGVSWGTYRVWSTVSWGLFGFIVGQINETPYLPKYVPAFLVLAGSCTLEILLLAVWPNHHFVIKSDDDDGDDVQSSVEKQKNSLDEKGVSRNDSNEAGDPYLGGPAHWAAGGGGTLPRSSLGQGVARTNPRLMGALANVLVDEMGQSLRSTLGRSSGKPKRGALAEVLEQHQIIPREDTPTLVNGADTPPSQNQPQNGCAAQTSLNSGANQSAPPLQSAINRSTSVRQDSLASGAKLTFGRSALLRASQALSHMDSLSSRSGHAIAQDLQHMNSSRTNSGELEPGLTGNFAQTGALGKSPSNANNSLSRAAAQRALALRTGGEHQAGKTRLGVAGADGEELSEEQRVAQRKKYAEDLQLMLLKLIVKRDPGILKYLLLFTFIGALFTAHLTFFFTHLEQICREHNYEFSNVMSIMVIAHSVSEVISFLLVVPYYMPLVGRVGSMLTIMVIFAGRFGFYGTYFVDLSPWWALITESGHGFVYGITYTLIMEVGTECVDKLDLYLPELIERRIVPAHMNAGELKLPLRATMFGLFSGAFDGLGNGIGALCSGIYLDSHSFVSLWKMCTYLAVAIALVYPLTEWRVICGRRQRANAAAAAANG